MAFLPFHMQGWRRGSTLVSEPDLIPDDSLRLARNIRLDRTLGVAETRPGWTQRTASAFASAVTFLSRLYGSAATYGYAQAGTVLYRLTSAWASATSIVAATGTTPLSGAISPDGQGDLWHYFCNGTIAQADNGTTTRTMGIAPPLAVSLVATLAADLSTTIDAMDNAAAWTGAGLVAGPGNDATYWIETPSSVQILIAASSFGSIARYNAAGAIDLDTLTGGDALVKDDDYIHLWVRADRPERIYFLQIDIDVDSTTTGVADAFQHNYYHVRLAGSTTLNQGNNSWTQVQVRKASFQRFGADTTRTWAHARTFRIGFQTTAAGAPTINIDDVKLRGGVGLEGDYEYTGTYRNISTGARGNPVLDADRVVQYTPPLRTNRQRINLDIGNLVQGGAHHPGDTQIDTLMLWRRGGLFPDQGVLVEEFADTTASPYVDDTADSTLALSPLLLETNNDVPPTGTTRVLFGPGGSGHLFLLVDGYRCYFSKGYERGENRCENWGVDNFVLVGDGSARAVAGIGTASRVVAWTTERTYTIVGIGEDTFLSVPVEGSRGCVGQYAVAAGDGALFFVGQDGIYADTNSRQTKLTSAIDPFFEGRTVDGQPGWNTTASIMALARLAYLNEATGSALVLLYAEAGSGTLNRFLVLKPDLQSGQLTECFFGTSNQALLQALYWDSVNRELLAGAGDGHVYRIEDPAVYSDAGTAIPVTLRTKSYDLGQPQRRKLLNHAVVEGHTSGVAFTLTAYYDRMQTPEVLGTVQTFTETAVVHLPTADPEAPRRDVALELTGSTTTRLALTRLGVFAEPQPEALTRLDSGIVSYDFVAQLKRFELDADVPAQCTLTVEADGAQVFTGQVLPTTGRRNLPYPLPPGMRGRTFRCTLVSSAGPFLVWRWSGFFRRLGTDGHYEERVLAQGV